MLAVRALESTARSCSLKWALAAGVLLVVWPALAEPEEAWAYNPGRLGPNALPTQPSEPAWIAPSPMATLQLAVQHMRPFGGDDFSFTLPFRTELPFAGRASLITEGQPFEYWSVSEATQRGWALRTRSSVSQADTRIGGKFLLFNGGERWPSVGLRMLTKTTTGKGFYDRRFINAPGYLFDLLLSHRLKVGEGWFIDLYLNGGFYSWQQGPYGQNDALAFSVAVRVVHPRVCITLDGRGYRGWQRLDKPFAVQLTVEIPFGLITGVSSATASLADPSALDVRAGVRVGAQPRPARFSDLEPGKGRVISGFKAIFFDEE